MTTITSAFNNHADEFFADIKKVLPDDDDVVAAEVAVSAAKKGPENTKIELNGVARPRFGPILSGNVAVDSLMLLVAPEPSKTL